MGRQPVPLAAHQRCVEWMRPNGTHPCGGPSLRHAVWKMFHGGSGELQLRSAAAGEPERLNLDDDESVDQLQDVGQRRRARVQRDSPSLDAHLLRIAVRLAARRHHAGHVEPPRPPTTLPARPKDAVEHSKPRDHVVPVVIHLVAELLALLICFLWLLANTPKIDFPWQACHHR